MTTTVPTCTNGGDCLVHPEVAGLHDFTPTTADELREIRQRLDRIEQRIQGIVETHNLWDGS